MIPDLVLSYWLSVLLFFSIIMSSDDYFDGVALLIKPHLIAQIEPIYLHHFVVVLNFFSIASNNLRL